MATMNHTLTAAVLGVALGAGTFGFFGGRSVSTALAEEGHRPHQKLHDADRAMAEAKEYLEGSKDDFHGHKEACLHRIMEARTEIALCLNIANEEHKR